MNKINIRYLISYIILYVLLQLPILYKFSLGENTIAFIYLGFILFFPLRVRPVPRLLTAFFTGLLIDIFTNTPGLHAGICVFIMFIREYYFLAVIGEQEEDPNLSVYTLGFRGMVIFLLPLIFIHLLLLFLIDQGSFSGFTSVLVKAFFSTLFTFVCIVFLNFAIARKSDRI